MNKKSYALAALLVIIVLAAVSFAVVGSYSSTTTTRLARSFVASIRHAFTPWQARLYSPTEFTKIGSLYFIVDCWHNRVLYSHSRNTPIPEWRVLDSDLAGPHSIASDSTLYVVEDTGRHAVRVYRYYNDTFRLVQIIRGCGKRPHRVRYDPATSAFYVIGSESQDITKLIRHADTLHVEYTKHLSFLHNAYTRSFTIADGFMFFVSGPKAISKARYRDDSYQLVETFPVPPSIQTATGMNDLFKTGNYYYLTSTPNVIIRTKSLEAFRNGEWEDLYHRLKLRGTPYYLSHFDGRIFVPQIDDYNGIISFVECDGTLGDVKTVFGSGPPILADWRVKHSLPK
jgi:ABC-type cobalt transport system substrate-binding protein